MPVAGACPRPTYVEILCRDASHASLRITGNKDVHLTEVISNCKTKLHGCATEFRSSYLVWSLGLGAL